MGVYVIDLGGDGDDIFVTVVADTQEMKNVKEKGKKVPFPAPQLEIVPVDRNKRQ